MGRTRASILSLAGLILLGLLTVSLAQDGGRPSIRDRLRSKAKGTSVSARQSQRGGGSQSQSANVNSRGRSAARAGPKSRGETSPKRSRSAGPSRGRKDDDRGRRLSDPRRSRRERIEFQLLDPRRNVQSDRPRGAPAVPRNSPRTQSLLFQIQAKALRESGVQLDSVSDSFDVLQQSLSEAPGIGDDGTELSRNFDILGLTYEGDAVLTEEQAEAILSGQERRSRFKRKMIASSGTNYRWAAKTVPYRLAQSGGNWETAVRAGIREWSESTCLRFVPHSSQRDYLVFQSGQGCYSNVGRVGGGQTVSIGTRCDIKGIVAHEIGHALGFWHEQSRPDRDGFVSILDGNILSGTQGNFLPQRNTNDYGNAYDYGSVMHYGAKAFARDWSQLTIQTKDANFQETIGQRNALSFSDVKTVNDAYCSDTCSGSRTSCSNGGYPDPKSCSRCRCPDGLGGSTCASPELSSGSCGGTMTATGEWQTLRSSLNGVKCNWLIRNAQGGKVWLSVTAVSYQQIYPDSCSAYVELKYKRSFEQTGARFCKGKPSTTLASQGSQAVVIHHTLSTRVGGSFTLQYRADGTTGPVATTRRPPTSAPRTAAPATRAPVTRAPATRIGAWGGWSACSRSCGGCGSRARSRYEGSRLTTARETCGTRACPVAAASSCPTRLRIPCSQADNPNLSFNPYRPPFRVDEIEPGLPNVTVRIVKRARRGRQRNSFDRRRKRQTGRRDAGRRAGRKGAPRGPRGPPSRPNRPPRRQQNNARRGPTSGSTSSSRSLGQRRPPSTQSAQRSGGGRMCRRDFTYSCGGGGGNGCCTGLRNQSGICRP